MTNPHDMLSWASLCFVTLLIAFCFCFSLFSFYVCLVNKMCRSFDRKKEHFSIADCGKTYLELPKTHFGADHLNIKRFFALVDVQHLQLFLSVIIVGMWLVKSLVIVWSSLALITKI